MKVKPAVTAKEIMKIYTKTGDDGTTGLFNGRRVSKASLRVESYGAVDELNSVLGMALSQCSDQSLRKDLLIVSNMLFTLGSDMATPLEPRPKFEVKRLSSECINWLEGKIDEYNTKLPELRNFILPGGSFVSACIHHARTVCRRAERRAIALAEEEPIGENTVRFLNRLSDYLFTAARLENMLSGNEEITADF